MQKKPKKKASTRLEFLQRSGKYTGHIFTERVKDRRAVPS